MSDVRVSVGGHTQGRPALRVLVLGAAAAMALIVLAVLVGRWSVSMSAATPDPRPVPAQSVAPTAPVGPGPVADQEPLHRVFLGHSGIGVGGGGVCLLARPC